MRLAYSLVPTILVILGIACGEEKNPYSSKVAAGSAATATGNGAGASTSTTTNTSTGGSPAGNAPTTTPAQTAANGQSAGTVATPNSIPQASAAGVNLICSNSPALAKVQAEVAVLCLNGKPTQAFADALAAPYKGGANPPLKLLKSVDNNGVSEFIALAILEVPKTAMDVFGKRADLATGTITAGNASTTQSVLANNPGTGGDNLAQMDVKFLLNVNAGIIKVATTTVQSIEFTSLNADKTLIASVSTLKQGAPENAQAILSNSVSFMLQEGTSTKLIQVNHQMANNRGLHATAEQTVLGIGGAAMTSSFTKLTQ